MWLFCTASAARGSSSSAWGCGHICGRAQQSEVWSCVRWTTRAQAEHGNPVVFLYSTWYITMNTRACKFFVSLEESLRSHIVTLMMLCYCCCCSCFCWLLCAIFFSVFDYTACCSFFLSCIICVSSRLTRPLALIVSGLRRYTIHVIYIQVTKWLL